MSSPSAPHAPPAAPPGPPSPRAPAAPGSGAPAAALECPVCTASALPPDPQCARGRPVCSRCRPQLARRPAGPGPPGDVRDPAPERVARAVPFPCAHARRGCARSLPAADRAAHERRCEFRPQPCPCPGAACAWRGALDAVVPHLRRRHEAVAALQGADAVFLAADVHRPGARHWLRLQACFGAHFLLALSKTQRRDGPQQLFATVQLVGTRQQAARFACRLELAGGDGRRLTWEATPRPIREGVFTAIKNGDCLALDCSMAQHFALDGNLSIKVTISECPNEPRRVSLLRSLAETLSAAKKKGLLCFPTRDCR